MSGKGSRTNPAWENDELTTWGSRADYLPRLRAHYFEPVSGQSKERYRCTLCNREVGKRAAQLTVRAREVAASPRFEELYPGASPRDILRPSLRNNNDPVKWGLERRFRGHRCPVYRLEKHAVRGRGGRPRPAKNRT